MADQKNKKSLRSPAEKMKQAFRTYKNKQKQRKKHAAKYPNDTESLARATRWTVPPTAK